MLIEEERQTQLELFARQLPPKPYCSDNVDYGLVIRQAKTAIKKRYIQHNKPTTVQWLVFDCDYPNAIEITDENNLPTPNIAIINRANGKSHLLYGLEVPVHKTQVARAKPLRYLAVIEYALREALGSDRGYTGLTCKNPLHEHWLTYQLKPQSYDLGELADYLTLPNKLPRKGFDYGLGKNCFLFENVRRWAYANLLNYRLTKTYEQWIEAVRDTATQFNNYPDPLPVSEVKATAKSVARWCWNNYTGRVSDEEFSKTQARRGKLGGLAKGQINAEKRATALQMGLTGATQQTIADTLGVSQRTISNWLK